MIGDVLKQMGISDKSMPRREIKEQISDAKNKSDDPFEFLSQDGMDDTILKIYRLYQARLTAANAMDFDDLLILTLELFRSHPDILEHYRRRFRYILVDEYQDTNIPQYKLVKLLSEAHQNICVVGDDDQSIYGWRGADIRNILGFERDFPGAKVIRLEQNYRSTNVILDAANSVISNNSGRKVKRLWTSRNGGEPIGYHLAPTERMEADFICGKILQGCRDGRRYDDFAVFYRMNAQSRVLEATLTAYRIPYIVYGGQRFYERREIKDIMAYLRLIYNVKDDAALRRIINIPRRGIGERAMDSLESAAQSRGISLFEATTDDSLAPAFKTKLVSFHHEIEALKNQLHDMHLSDFTEYLVEAIDYEAYLEDDKKGERETRMQNVRELIGNIMEIESSVEDTADPLAVFLENVALVSDIDSMRDDNGCVSLMTLHSAKGLEFPVVFMAGMEDNIFPMMRARNDSIAMEEERRLCYVGITRAKDKLYMVGASERSLFGDWGHNRPSCFLSEIPETLFEDAKSLHPAPTPKKAAHAARTPVTYGMPTHGGFGVASAQDEAQRPKLPSMNKKFVVGQKVKHAAFGEGSVMEINGAGNAMIIAIDFYGIGG